MRDGVELSTDIRLPDGDTPVSVVLARTPYNKNGANNLATAQRFVERGYGFAWVDVRGRGDSDGTFDPYRQEGKDGFDTIEWMAEQSWCDGRVATWGESYLGTAQILAAVEKPPHLSAMIVHVPLGNQLKDFPTGITSPVNVSWFRLVQNRLLQSVGGIDWRSVYLHLPVISMDEAAGFVSDQWRNELSHAPDDSKYWEWTDFHERLDQVGVPALHVTGWYDDVQPGALSTFQVLSDRAATPAARAGQQLIVGPWDHNLTHGRSRCLGMVDFGDNFDFDLEKYELDWLDHHLRGVDNGVDRRDSVHYFVMGANQWRCAKAWPPSDSLLPLYLADGGRLCESPGTQSVDEYDYDPSDPYPFITAETSAQLGGPDDYSEVEKRSDVLLFSSDQLEQSIEVTGNVRAELWVTTDGPDTDFMAKLLDVHPDGFVQRLCDGMVRLRFRDGLRTPALATPGEAIEVNIDLWSTSHVFLEGHRIRLEIASSAFPKYDRNLNTGSALSTGIEMRVAHNSVLHGGNYTSRLILPSQALPEGTINK